MTLGRLAGKVAIVTGAGTRKGAEVGTGRAIAVSFAKEGAMVLLVDLSLENADETLGTIRRDGGEASVFQADVSMSGNCESMVAAAVQRYGSLDILVNNVGIEGRGDVENIDMEILHWNLDVNLKSAVFASKFAIPEMVKSGGGSIINISSIDGLLAGYSQNVAYAVSKGGLHMLTRTTAAYHGRQGIRANCIAPGHIHASMTTTISEEDRSVRRAVAPLGTEGTAWDIAWAAVFLASDEARWISGIVLPVDGGLLATAPLTAYFRIHNSKDS